MRLTRILLWSTGILLAAILVACLMLALFFPQDSFEEKLKGSLNDRIRPLRIDFAGIRLFWKDGPCLSVDELRVFASETRAGGHDAFLSAGRLTFRPSLEGLAARQVAAHFIVESPAFRSDQAEGEVPALAGIVGALAEGLGAPRVGQGGDASSPRPESLSALVPLPAGFTLTGASLEMRDGSLEAAPSSAVSGMRASLRVEPDLSFRAELTKGTLRWSRDEKGPLRLSSIVGAEIRGRAVSLEGLQVEGTLRLEETVLEWQERTATVAEPVKLAFRLQGTPERVLSIPEIQLAGPGLEIGMAGSMRLKEDGPGAIKIQDLRVNLENWQPFCSLAFPETDLSGKLSVVAERLEIDPGRIVLPALREDAFGTTRPEGLSCEGLALRFTKGHLARADLTGTTVSLDGLHVNIEQQEGGWTGTTELSGLEAAAGETLRVSGPLSVKARWSESGGSTSTAILVVDLTRGRLAYKDLLDKPPDVSLQLGVRARIRPDEIRVGRAFLNLGDTEWTVEGSVRDPAEPFLIARLASDIVSLEALATISPVMKEHALGGRVEIKELTLAGRLGAIRESTVLTARVASKDLTVHGTSVKGVYGQAVYGEQKLTIDPVVIQPTTTGMINAAFSADFSEAYQQEGLHQYYGTLHIDHVELDELLRLASPDLEGKARGITDANLAFRGTGLAWPEAAATMEAKARVYVNHLALDGGDGEDTGSEESLSERLGQIAEGIDTEETVLREEDLIHPEQERLLTANRAAGWFTLEEGNVHTDSLVAIYEGRLIEIQGSVDLAGHLQVEMGKLFNGGRMIPFRLDCRLGEDRCRPTPDLKEMGKSAAAELTAGLRQLSETAQGVYRDLPF